MNNPGNTEVNYAIQWPMIVTPSEGPYTSEPSVTMNIDAWSQPELVKMENGVHVNEFLFARIQSDNVTFYEMVRAYCENGVSVIRNTSTNELRIMAPNNSVLHIMHATVQVVKINDINYNVSELQKNAKWSTINTGQYFRGYGVRAGNNLQTEFLYTDGVTFNDTLPDDYFHTGNDADSIDINKPEVHWTVMLSPDYKSRVTISWDSLPPNSYDFVNIQMVPFSVGTVDDHDTLEFDPYPPQYPLSDYARNVAVDVPWQEGQYVTDYAELRSIAGGYDNILKRPMTLILRASKNGHMTAVMIVQLEQGKAPARDGQYYEDDTPLDSTITVKTAGKGDNIKPPQDNDKTDPDSDDPENLITEGYGRGRELTTTFWITREDLRELGMALWTKGILDTTILSLGQAPIENIVSVKLMPTNYSTQVTSTVYIGNVTTTITGKIVDRIPAKKIGQVQIPESYGNFLDYEPYTTCSIFLPFIGFKPVPTNYIIGKTLSVEYIYDVVAGSCKALIKSNDYPIMELDGECGIDIPLTSSNRAAIEAAMIGSFVGAIIDQSASSAISMVQNMIKTPSYESTSSVNSTCSAMLGLKCFVIVDRPVSDISSTYAHDFGMLSNVSAYISDLSGFTVCCDSVDLSHIPCTLAELEQIRDVLTTGFYA